MRTLQLVDSPWSIAYSRIILALKTDPHLSATIDPGGWRTYTDEPDNDVPAGDDTLPAIEALPHGLPARSESPTAQYSPFAIALNIACAGTDVRDLMNLWGCVHNALFPGDGSRDLFTAIRADFAAARNGAQLEQIQLTMPALTPTAAQMGKQVWLASGTILITIRVRK